MEKSKILIVDDLKLNCEMLSEILGDQYEYTYAEDGIKALNILSKLQIPDIILLDLNMPKMNGMDVLRAMNVNRMIEKIPVIIISAEEDDSIISQAYKLGATDFITRPFRACVVQNRVSNTLLVFKNQRTLLHMVENQVKEREKINNSMINIFSNIIEQRNHESGSHTLNVQNITNLILHRLVEITDKYEIRETDIVLISSLAAMHDLGKIKIPESILNKPGKLTEEEWALMKTHTTEGDKMLSDESFDQNSKFVRTARTICRHHHEKYDGNGYPDGLKGDEIPISAQVVSIADVYDALTSDRCYKKAFSHERAMEMILGGECGIFNPLILKCLTDISEQLKELMRNSGHIDYQSDISGIIGELLANNDLPKDDALCKLLDNESKKKFFFMENCYGVLFEYDKLLHKITYVYPQELGEAKRKVAFNSRTSEDNLLPIEYWDALREKLLLTTSDDPVVRMDVELRLNGKLFPCHATAMAIWSDDGHDYISVVGHFTPIYL